MSEIITSLRVMRHGYTFQAWHYVGRDEVEITDWSKVNGMKLPVPLPENVERSQSGITKFLVDWLLDQPEWPPNAS